VDAYDEVAPAAGDGKDGDDTKDEGEDADTEVVEGGEYKVIRQATAHRRPVVDDGYGEVRVGRGRAWVGRDHTGLVPAPGVAPRTERLGRLREREAVVQAGSAAPGGLGGGLPLRPLLLNTEDPAVAADLEAAHDEEEQAIEGMRGEGGGRAREQGSVRAVTPWMRGDGGDSAHEGYSVQDEDEDENYKGSSSSRFVAPGLDALAIVPGGNRGAGESRGTLLALSPDGDAMGGELEYDEE